MDFFKLNLQLFAEGGAGAGGDGSGSGDSAAAAEGSFASSTNAKNPLANVVYGKPVAEGAEGSGGQAAPEGNNKDAEFKALIKGDYKDQYGAAVKAAVDARFKSTQEIVDKYNRAAPLFEALGAKYGADASDIDAIIKAVGEDDSYFEDAAIEHGMDVKQYKELRRMERENASLKAQMDAQRNKEQSEQIFARWQQEAEKTKQIYPSFDMEAEIKNPQFANLLRSNIDVQTAYEVVHKDEIIPQAMKFAVTETERKISNSIAANGRRPAESATRGSSSSVVKPDVSQLSYADRREIERRVAMGEKITF